MPTAPNARNVALATLSDIANDNLRECARQEAAARVLLAARRAADLLDGGADGEVEAIAADWDPRAVTAREFAEVLRPRDLDRLVLAAPRWARERLRALRAA